MKLKKVFKLISLALVVTTVSFLWLSCSSGPSSTTSSSSQAVTVQSGNLTTYITATGNLAFSTTQDLAFGQSGQVAQVNVKVGDNITQGQVLAKLDTTDLEQAVDSANLSVQSAQIGLVNAQNAKSNITDQELAVQSAQISLTVAQNAQSGITSSQIDLDTANNNLNKISYPYTFTTFNLNVPAAIQAIHDAKLQLQLAAADLKPVPTPLQPNTTPDYGDALLKFQKALDSLMDAEGNLLMGTSIANFLASANVTSGNRTAEASLFPVTDYWTLQAAQVAITKAQLTLDNTKNSYKTGLDTANLNLVKAQQSLQEAKNSYTSGLAQANVNLASAQNNLAKAQRNLQEAIITAPFTGIVTAVNISAGQLVGSGQVAISIADPTKLEANVLVNEIDIPWVTTQSRVTLQMDAVSAVNIPAKVTQISPTATVSSGVVNYTVTIEVQSATINASTQTGRTSSSNQTAPTPSAQPRPTTGQSGQARSVGRASQTAVPSTIQLRQGLSATANIVKEERRNVLLVPSRAISQQAGKSSVQVVKDDGTTEARVVQTGLTDGQNTEITSGLSEGEKIISVAKTTTTTTTPAGGGSIIRPGGLLR